MYGLTIKRNLKKELEMKSIRNYRFKKIKKESETFIMKSNLIKFKIKPSLSNEESNSILLN